MGKPASGVRLSPEVSVPGVEEDIGPEGSAGMDVANETRVLTWSAGEAASSAVQPHHLGYLSFISRCLIGYRVRFVW